MKNATHMLVQDDDSHWYVIARHNLEAFDRWLESEDAQLGLTPDWIDPVGGSPTLVEFHSEGYSIDGKQRA